MSLFGSCQIAVAVRRIPATMVFIVDRFPRYSQLDFSPRRCARLLGINRADAVQGSASAQVNTVTADGGTREGVVAEAVGGDLLIAGL